MGEPTYPAGDRRRIADDEVEALAARLLPGAEVRCRQLCDAYLALLDEFDLADEHLQRRIVAMMAANVNERRRLSCPDCVFS